MKVKGLALLLSALLVFPSLRVTAMDFTAPLYGGGTFKLSNFRGKVVVVMFASVYCGACRKHMPELASAWRSDPDLSSDRYVGLVAMISNYKDPDSMVEMDADFFRNLNPPSNWYLSPEPWDLVFRLGIRYTPTVVIIDPQGNVYAKVVGTDLNLQIRLIKEAARQKDVKVNLEVKSTYTGMETLIGGTVTGGKVSNLTLVFTSPSGEEREVDVPVSGGRFSLSTTFNEPGVWTVSVSVGGRTFSKKFLVKVAYYLALNGSESVIFREDDVISAQIFDIGQKLRLGGVSSLPQGRLVLLGGPQANKFVRELNQRLGITVLNKGGKGKIRVLDYTLNAEVEYGKLDYALVVAAGYEGRVVIAVQGLTRYGTFAASLMLHAGYLNELSYAVIRWADLDGDSSVSFDEIEVVRSGIYSFES